MAELSARAGDAAVPTRGRTGALDRCAGLVHDLQNSLTAAQFRLRILVFDEVVMARQRDNLAGLEGILRSAVALARSHAVRAPEITSACLDAAVRAAFDIAATPADGEPALELDSRIGHLPEVQGTPAQVERVFLNLFTNARQALGGRGTVIVRGRARGRDVLVEVQDGGPGIRRTHAAHLFAPGFTTSGAQGRGLGLAIAKEVMSDIGGIIRLRRRTNAGACFTITFRAAALAVSAAG